MGHPSSFVSACFYCRKNTQDLALEIGTSSLSLARIILTFYKQGRDVRRFLDSTPATSTSRYLRVLAVGLIDIVLTLPLGIMGLTSTIQDILQRGFAFAFYEGWDVVHRVTGLTYGASLQRSVLAPGAWDAAQFYVVT